MNELYNNLIDAYSPENLNRITGKLIDLYKNKNHGTIREIANQISQFVVINEEKDSRCFSRLIMLYHPDRVEYFKQTLQSLYAGRDEEGLRKFSHILHVEEIINAGVFELEEDIDYCPEYVWDIYDMDDCDNNGFNRNRPEYMSWDEMEKTFYNAVRLREFGFVDSDYPTWFLEEMEDYELSKCGLYSLDGIEYCLNLISLDLSFNQITDISDLWNLDQLQELYLGNNHIGFIDSLSNLSNLRIIDLSGNEIDDISPLFELENLEYLNLLGNPVPEYQIRELSAKGVLVTH